MLALQDAILTAGIGQIALALGSLAIPRVLAWQEDTAKLRPLTRQIFWTYAGYIFSTNLSFGVLSALAPASLLDRSTLAAAVTGFIAVYWGARLAIQFLVLDRSETPQGAPYRAAEFALVSLFITLTAVYTAAVAWNLSLLSPATLAVWNLQ